MATASSHAPWLSKMNLDRSAKLERLSASIERQRRFMYTVPDSDNRERAAGRRTALRSEHPSGIAVIWDCAGNGQR